MPAARQTVSYDTTRHDTAPLGPGGVASQRSPRAALGSLFLFTEWHHANCRLLRTYCRDLEEQRVAAPHVRFLSRIRTPVCPLESASRAGELVAGACLERASRSSV
jgi:hypothetical protein